MKYSLYLILFLFLFSCEVDNIGPLLNEEGIIFFMEDGLEVSENNSGPIVIEVGAIGDGAYSSSVTISGDATEGIDYKLLTDLDLDFPAGVYTDNISLELMDNSNFDDDHMITFSLPSGQGYSENNRREFHLSILNDDASSGSVVTAISSSIDDVEEGINGDSPGSMDVESSDLEFGEVEGGTRGMELVGLTFHDIRVPKGVNIKSAKIQFTVDEVVDNPAPVVMIIRAEAADSPAPFSANNFDISSRTQTNASVEWNIPVWTTVGDASGDQRTIDFGPVIKELIDRPGWIYGSDINIIFSPSEATLQNGRESGRVAEAYDGEPESAPVLTIEWEL